MLAIINRILDWIKSLFWKEEMELTLVGLQYSGKTTFVNVIAVSIPENLICVFCELAFVFKHPLKCILIFIVAEGVRRVLTPPHGFITISH